MLLLTILMSTQLAAAKYIELVFTTFIIEEFCLALVGDPHNY